LKATLPENFPNPPESFDPISLLVKEILLLAASISVYSAANTELIKKIDKASKASLKFNKELFFIVDPP
jgi:hypothetical protein